MEKISNFFDAFAKNMRSILGFTIIVLSFAFLFTILFITIPAGNVGIVNTSVGFVLGILASVATYYFGSSKDKSDVDKANIEKDKAGK